MKGKQQETTHVKCEEIEKNLHKESSMVLGKKTYENTSKDYGKDVRKKGRKEQPRKLAST